MWHRFPTGEHSGAALRGRRRTPIGARPPPSEQGVGRDVECLTTVDQRCHPVRIVVRSAGGRAASFAPVQFGFVNAMYEPRRWITSRRVLAALVLICAIPLTAPRAVRADQTTSAPLNFVFFLVDDLGWRDLGCYGSSFYETPNVDALAARGMRFTNAYAACRAIHGDILDFCARVLATLPNREWQPGGQGWSSGLTALGRRGLATFRPDAIANLSEVTSNRGMSLTSYPRFVVSWQSALMAGTSGMMLSGSASFGLGAQPS